MDTRLARGAVFVDTSAWYAIISTSDTNHRAATNRFRYLVSVRRELVTTNRVAAEAFTLVRLRLGHDAAFRFLERLRTSGTVRRVFVSEAWEEEAERLLAQFGDQMFSYVDATSFVAMRRLGLTEAFAFDRDFVVAGFTLTGDA